MQQLANAIQAHLDTLVDQYDARLQTMPGYVNFPAAARRDLERQILGLVAKCLTVGDSQELVHYVRQRAAHWAAAGLEIAWFQAALIVPEEILVPLIESVEASTFLWQALNRSQAAVWQLVAERLQQSEERFRRFSAATEEGLLFHEQGKILDVNPAMLALFGYSAVSEIIGRNMLEFIVPEQRGLVIQQMQLESVTPYEINCIRKDGTTFPVETSTRAYQYGDQTVRASSVRDITGRKRTEDALRQSQQLLQTVMDNIPQAVFWKDRNLTYLGCNLAFAEDAGLTSPAEIVGKTDYDMPWQPQADLYRADDQRVVESGTAKINYEEPQTTPTGEQTWLRTSKVPMRDAHNNITAVLGMYEDITARKRAEESLRDNEERLRAIYEGTNDAVMLLNERGFFDCNPRTLDMFGFKTREEFTAAHPADVSPQHQPDGQASLPAAQAHIQTAYRQGYDRFEWIHRRTNGEDFSAEVLLSAVDIGQQRVLQATVRDITERKQAEAALSQERSLLRTLIDNLPDQVFFKDTQGHIILYNEADARAMRVASTEEALGKTVYDLFPHELADRYHADDMGVIQSGMPLYNREEPGVDEAGQPRWVLTTKVPLRDTQGNPIGLVGMARDITQQKVLEQSIRDSFERRGRQVEVTRQVSQEIAAAPELSNLFQRVVTLIKEHFNYYHTQIFRYDAIKDGVMLVAGYGEVGHKMLEAGHQLPMGYGVVGKAAETGQSILAADVTQDPDWQVNPNLPETKGELAVPIKLRDEVLGILDVQSERAGALTDDDRLLIEGLCGQIATAMESTRLLNELRSNEAQLSQALQIAKLAYWEYDVANDLFFFNDQFYAIFHTTAEREGGYQLSSAQYAQKFVYPDDLPVVGAEIEKALTSTDRHYRRELNHRIQYADGGIGHISVSINIDRDEQGRILRYYGANQDITDRKLAEVALTEEHTRLRTLIDNLPVSVYIKDRDSRFVVNNAVHLRILGAASQEEVSGKWDFDYFPQELAEQYHADEQELMRIGQPLFNREESVVDQSSGQQHWALSTKVPLRDIHGQVTGFLGFTQDITERKLAEETVRRSQADLSQALQIARLAYWEYDVAQDLFHFNDQFYAIFHTTAEQQGGYQLSSAQYAQRFVYPDDLPVVGAEIEKALNSTDRHYSRQLDHRIQYADGGIGYISVNINIDRDEQGHILRYYGANQDITESKLAEEAVRRSEAELSEALQIAKLGYWEYDVERDLFMFNDQFYTLFHTTAAQHGGYQLPSAYYAEHFVHPDDRGLVGAEIGRSLNSTDRHYNRLLEHRIVYTDGSLGYISVNINIDRDEQGKILRVYGANQDITDRKQAEEAMRASEEKYRDLINGMNDTICVIDFNTTIVDVNNAATRVLGYTRDELLSMKIPDIDANLAPDQIQNLAGSMPRDKVQVFETWHKTKTGERLPVEVSSSLVSYGGQTVILSIARDITERKRAEIELKETEERFRIIAETTPVPILISAVADGSVLYGNDQLGQMFGIPIAELIGRPTPDFYFDPADRQVLLTQLRQAGALRDYELHVKRADGTPFWVLVSMRTLMFAGQRALFAAFIDITTSRQAAEELRRSEAQLSEALKTARLAYWELDLARQKFIFNDQLYALLHTTAEAEGGYEMDINAYVGRFIYPEDIPYVGATIAQGLQNPDPTVSTQLEARVICADGEVRWLATQVSNKVNEAGQPFKAVGTNQDITDRKQAEETVRRSEAQLSQALQIAKLAYWEYDVAKDLFLFNDQFYAIFHTTAEREGGYQLSSAQYAQRFVYPDDLPVVGAEIAKALNSTDQHYSRQIDHRIQYAEGGVGYISVSINIDRDEQGQILRYYGANQDITEAKLAEAEVQRSEQLMRTVIDSTPDWIFIKDQEHRYRLANQGYADSLHIPVDSFIGHDDLELGFPEDLVKGNPDKGIAGFWADDRAVMDSGQPKLIPNDIVSIDGALRIYNTIKTPLHDIDGHVWAVLAFARDITEREHLMAQQQKRALQLQTAAEVSRVTSSILSLDELLPQAVELVRARFNLYYVGIFLNDEPQRWAVLRAGTGDAGQMMLAAGHKLKIGAASMISQCIVKQQARIALDVGEEAVRFDNPLLPLTRSELALPLISRGRVIGAVTIQSDQPAAFTSDDIIVLQTMADQTGNAIENARLYEQSTAALQEVDALNRRLTGEGWETYLRRGLSQQVIWAGDDESIAPAALAAADEQLSAGQIVIEPAPGDEQQTTVSVPVMLRGQTIGALRVAMPEAAYTDELRATLEALAGHVAQSAENARLLDETQARFARERALAEATDKIRRRPEVEHILQTAAEELAHYLQASAINVRLGSSMTAAGETAQPGGRP